MRSPFERVLPSQWRRRRVTSALATVAVALSLTGAVSFVGASHGAPALADASTGTGGEFVATQARALDTRPSGSTGGTGGYTTPMPAGTWRSVLIAGVAGVPSSGAGAVQVTVTALSPASTGTVQLSADLVTPQTGTALAYGSVSGNISNTAIVAMGSNGKIKVEASSTVDLLIDVQGYYTAGTTADGGYASVSPARLVDTRNGTGLPQAQLSSGSTTTITVGGQGGIPSNASAVFVNFTVTNNVNGGLLTPYNSDLSRPNTSLNFEGGVSTALGTTVDLSSTGKMSLYMSDGGASLDVVVDVFGYFTGSSANGAFTPATARAATNLILPASSVTAVQVGGINGVPQVSPSVATVAANIQETQTGNASGYIRAWPATDPEPSTSTIMLDHQASTVSNFATVALGGDGRINFRNSSTDALTVTIDIQGWYAYQYSTADQLTSTEIIDGGVQAITEAQVAADAATPDPNNPEIVAGPFNTVPTGGFSSPDFQSDQIATAANHGGCWTHKATARSKNVFGGVLFSYTFIVDWCGDGKWMTHQYKRSSASTHAPGWRFSSDKQYSIYGVNYQGARWNLWKTGGNGKFCFISYYGCPQETHHTIDMVLYGSGDWRHSINGG